MTEKIDGRDAFPGMLKDSELFERLVKRLPEGAVNFINRIGGPFAFCGVPLCGTAGTAFGSICTRCIFLVLRWGGVTLVDVLSFC